jgi:hypothetical protein
MKYYQYRASALTAVIEGRCTPGEYAASGVKIRVLAR